MMTLPDLLYVAWFAAAGPMIDYLVFWPALRRRSEKDPARTRRRAWAWTIVSAWALVGLGAALWAANHRSWKALGFSVPEGWRLWTSIAVFLLLAAYHVWGVATLARNSDARASARQQIGTLTAAVLPHTRTEMYLFAAVALTAGFCEEFLFRGYFIVVLAPWLGWWGAAALSVLLFAIWHVYQGWNGVLRTGLVGAFFTLVVAVFGSLWPAIAFHALVDLGQGMMAWLVLREGTTGDVVERERPTQPQSASEVQPSSVQADLGAAPNRGGK